MRLAKRLAFLHLDNFFGVTRGEQPLVRASRASKVAGTFLVLFWCTKENLALRNSALLYYTPNPPDFYDQVPNASIFRPSATLQGRASVLYFLRIRFNLPDGGFFMSTKQRLLFITTGGTIASVRTA